MATFRLKVCYTKAMQQDLQQSQPPDTKKTDEYISPYAEKLKNERIMPFFELIESEARHHKAVMGYSSDNTTTYAFIELGDGYPEAIMKIARFTHKTPQKVLEEYITQHAESIINYAKHIDEVKDYAE